MNELLRLLRIIPGPEAHGKTFIHIACGVDFEPHGAASEDWEIYWTLQLSQIPHHWKSTTGWRHGTTDKPISFHGRTFEEVVARAVAFLKEYKSQ